MNNTIGMYLVEDMAVRQGQSSLTKEEAQFYSTTYFKNTTLIQFGMECVRGPLKFQLMMTTVTRIETVFMMKVNRRYLSMK